MLVVAQRGCYVHQRMNTYRDGSNPQACGEQVPSETSMQPGRRLRSQNRDRLRSLVSVDAASRAAPIRSVTMKCPTAIGSSILLFVHQRPAAGVVALIWPLVASFTGLPGMIGDIQLAFARKLGFLPPEAMPNDSHTHDAVRISPISPFPAPQIVIAPPFHVNNFRMRGSLHSQPTQSR